MACCVAPERERGCLPQWPRRCEPPGGGHDLGRSFGPRKARGVTEHGEAGLTKMDACRVPALEGESPVFGTTTSRAFLGHGTDRPPRSVRAGGRPYEGRPRCLGEHRGRTPPGRCAPRSSAVSRPIGGAGEPHAAGSSPPHTASGPTSLRGPSAPVTAVREGPCQGRVRPRDGVQGERTKPPVPGRRSGRRISARPEYQVYSRRDTTGPSNDRPAEHDGPVGQRTTPRERIAHRIELRRSDMMITKNYIPRESLIERC